MPRLSLVLVSALLGATLALPAAAQWKWRDRNGQIQYSDLPPPAGVAEHDILLRPTSGPAHRVAVAAPTSAASASLATPPLKTSDPELEAKRRQAAQEDAAKKKAEEERVAALHAENCTRAKAHLRTLEDGIRIARVNDKGEREILDDAQRAEETRRTREIVASECRQ